MLHKIYKYLSKIKRLIRVIVLRITNPWVAGPLLGLAAFCPLYLFTLAGSWLPHLLVLCLLWTGWLLLKRQNHKAAWLAAWVVLAASALVPQQEIAAPAPAAGTSLKVAQVNVLQFNSRHEMVTRQIEALGADILAFQEVNQPWADSLVKVLSAEYPYFSLAPQDNCYGMALFSKKPLKEVQLRLWEGYPAISARIEENGQDTLILSLHAASPVSLERFRARNKQLKAAARFIEEAGVPTLVLGDFNTVPWDPALKPLLQAANLQDSRSLHYTATWPSFFGKWGIPIDYVLHSPHWQRLSHGSVSIPGSDHKAMVATLAMKASPAQEQNNILVSAQP
ncbi:Endonuclease/exonuclease/phosphatase [Flammeovirgaceae bacterium 311]|nr:Endonuclease/exonuclease/phosphatase [Flammeovirgaceae bacterium 311]